MASVTEDSLDLAAHQVVASFVNDGATLNDGVRKKASDLGLNRDQTARLIERTNSEAFLRVFPEKTDFAVADPSILLDGSEKTASFKDENVFHKPTYIEMLDRDFDAIFGNTQTKTASYDTPVSNDTRGKLVDIVYSQRISEEVGVEKMAKFLEAEKADANLWEVFKTAAYVGVPVASMETELMQAFPDRLEAVSAVVDALSEKLASSLLPPEVMKRASKDTDITLGIPESEITRAFQAVIDVVG